MIEEAERFFEFFERCEVGWWKIEALPRKVDGSRGAPIGARFGSKDAWPSRLAAANAFELYRCVVAAGRGRRGVDLVCCESPRRAGSRILLLDDLDGIQVDELLNWWSGPLVVLETSHNNHQALLVAPRPLARGDHLSALKALAKRFDGDSGACSSGQLHRFPGSLNFKVSCIDSGKPFRTLTVEMRAAEIGAAAGQLDELLAVEQRVISASRSRKRTNAAMAQARQIKSNSEAAFAWTLEQLKAGVSHERILEELSTRWLAHHNPRDWPARTLHNALYVLGLVPSRYRSGR